VEPQPRLAVGKFLTGWLNCKKARGRRPTVLGQSSAAPWRGAAAGPRPCKPGGRPWRSGRSLWHASLRLLAQRRPLGGGWRSGQGTRRVLPCRSMSIRPKRPTPWCGTGVPKCWTSVPMHRHMQVQNAARWRRKKRRSKLRQRIAWPRKLRHKRLRVAVLCKAFLNV